MQVGDVRGCVPSDLLSCNKRHRFNMNISILVCFYTYIYIYIYIYLIDSIDSPWTPMQG